jgi:hypothetical protein
MAKAFYTDDSLDKSIAIGQYKNFEAAKKACIEHALKQPDFTDVLLAEDDGIKGFDMMVVLKGKRLRQYFANR